MSLCAALHRRNGEPCPCKASIRNIDGTLDVCVRHFEFVEEIRAKILENAAKKVMRANIAKDNEKIIEENKGKIPLRDKQGNIIDFALVSEEDYERVIKHRWSKKANATNAYAVACIDGVHVRMHHLILGKPEEGYHVDHYPDRNGLNNRRNNLRFATYSQNQQNKPALSGATSKYKGVRFEKNRWVARSCDQFLGYFDTEEEAAKQYDRYVLLKYGGEAYTNDFVTWEEVKDIDINSIIPKKEKTLPLYVTKYNSSKYQVRRKYKEYITMFIVDTIEEAEEKIKQIEKDIKGIIDKEKDEHFKKPIIRNDKGQAVVPIRNKKGEKVDETVVSDECWHGVTQYLWSKKNDNYYAAHIDGKKILLHRYIMKAKHGDIIDHKNENGDTCKINTFENLRVNNPGGNSHNRKKSEGTSSQYFGVSFSKNELKFSAQIRKERNKYNLGYYDKDVKAAIAYNIMSNHLYGEFSRQNDIDKSDIDLYYDEVYDKIAKRYLSKKD